MNNVWHYMPVIPLEERMEMLKALHCVDIIRPYYELAYVSGCKALNANIFVVGEDWRIKPHNSRSRTNAL